MDKKYYKNIEEIWKDIAGYVGLYMISNWGRVKSLNFNRTRKEQILKLHQINKYGYLQVALYKNNKPKRFLIHKLVLETFIGPCHFGKEGCHNDGNPSNNFVGNLRWDTRKRNMNDQIKHGTKFNKARGSKQHLAKVNDNKVMEIRRLWQEGNLTQEEIANIYGIKKLSVWRIVNYQTWKHVK